MDIIKKIKIKNKIKEYIIVTIALAMSAVCFNLFLIPLDIVSGGTGGIATITKYLFSIDQSLMIGILFVVFLFISWIFLGKEKTLATTYVSLIYPILVRMTYPLADIVDYSHKDMFIVVIFAGLIYGLSSGLVYKTGNNNGGISVINQILYEKFNISVAKSSTFINGLIVLAGAFCFGPTKAMYAVIFLYITKLVMDKVLLGISRNKVLYIVTKHSEEIADYIVNVLNHKVTYFKAKTGILEKKKEVLLIVIPTSEYYLVKEGVKILDKNAFFVATDSYEVKGAD